MPARNAPSTTSSPKGGRDRQQEQEQHDGEPERDLGRGMLTFFNDPLDSPAARETWRQGEDEGEHPDRGDRKDRDELALRAEEERDAENRQQFADRACRHDIAAELPREQVVLT